MNQHPLTLLVAWPPCSFGVYEKRTEETMPQFLERIQQLKGHGSLLGRLVGFMSSEQVERYRQARRNQLEKKQRAADEAVADFDKRRANRTECADDGWEKELRKESAKLAGQIVYKHLPVINHTERADNGFVRVDLEITGITAFGRCLKFFQA